MLISFKWLQKYLPELHTFSHQDIAVALTNSLAEVESIRTLRSELTEIYIGEIIEVKVHPKNEKLNICQVKLAEDKINQIVCGAANVRPGLKVAVCLPGGSVINTKGVGGKLEITTREISGEFSEGMICSAQELGLGENNDKIFELEPESVLGTALTDELWDTIYEIENKALGHRSYAFSHLGIAREIAAILATPFNIPQTTDNTYPAELALPLELNIKLGTDLCARFSAVILREVVVQDSPFWLQALISGVGVRPINNIVDVTNYIMLDIGQPLHAYDYDKLQTKQLLVRRSKQGETVKTLDGKVHTLTKDISVISDGKSIEGLAGIMGGFDTQITSNTKTIVLEAANFNMFNIRRSSREVKLRTEASIRFEKGLDPEQTKPALEAAVSLIVDIFPQTEIATPILDHYLEPVAPKVINLDTNLVNRFLGTDLSKQMILDYLDRINVYEEERSEQDDANVNEAGKSTYSFVIPTYRLDLQIAQDLIEEVARLYGYANLKPALPEREGKSIDAGQTSLLIRQSITAMTSLGFDEVMTYSFVGEEQYTALGLDIKNCLELTNPIAPELSHMRNSLVPSLISCAYENAKNFSNFSIFEIGRIVDLELDSDGIHKQPFKLSGVTYAPGGEVFFEIKGALEEYFKKFGVTVNFADTPKDFEIAKALHPGKRAGVYIGNVCIGVLGELAPSKAFAKKFSDQSRVGLFDINLTLVQGFFKASPILAKAVSTFPEVIRDISFWTHLETKYATVTEAITSLKSPLVQNIELIDVFEKPAEDRKSMTLRLTLQSSESTLGDQEISAEMQKISASIVSAAKAEIR